MSVTTVNNCHFPVEHCIQYTLTITLTSTNKLKTSKNTIVSKIDFTEALIATFLLLSKVLFFLTIFLVPCIVVISTYLAIVTITEVVRNRRVVYASPPVQIKHLMNEIYSDIFHKCKSNIDIIELEIFKFIKIALIIYFFMRKKYVLSHKN